MKNEIHVNFELNKQSFKSIKELLAYTKDINSSIHDFLLDWFDEKNYVIVNTSGSTGKPKPMQLRKEFMINSAKATGAFFNLPENTSALLCLSTDYIAGKMMLVRALVLGWKLDVVTTDSNPLKNVTKHYDFSAMVPMQLQNSLSDLHKVQKLIVGGGVVSNELIAQIQGIDTAIFATYGMTETVTHIAVKQLNQFIVSNEGQVSNYYTLPNVEVSKDKRGCLVINAPKVAEEVIVTNDVVNLISNTSFMWLGRYDNVINSGGVKLHPEKIEEKLSTMISNRFFVTGIPDNRLGEKLVLLIEGVADESLEIDLKNELENSTVLTKYEVPKEIHFIEAFVETETKKIQRTKTLDLIYV
ncbi:AMP-binding protein [uncultured Tenacibaculum sp.]|uniref:AMP-binding protein n=1 Tax=uncultured Tenacibaculum sp. TaxID=174713 RepID=UPI00262714CF|nr:AMP-binding protein [uncultured Tenacibaculum sp.]